MEERGEGSGSVPEILYEVRQHASRPYSSSYLPLNHQLNQGTKGNFFTRGLSELKEKWTEYRYPPKLRKWTSLFISPGGEYVAITVGNQITILRKDDDYQEPCGVFTGSGLVTFVCGAWSEYHEVLGVSDDTDTLYFIKVNGEEITRITKRHLKLSLPVLGIFVENDNAARRSCLCTFSIVTSDGSLHDIEISQDPSASISTTGSSNSGSILMKEFPQNVFCSSYDTERSLLATVSGSASISSTSSGSTWSYNLSLWRRNRESGLELFVSIQFEGLYSKPKGYAGHLTSPRVLFSPQGEYVATLDLRGCLVIFKVNEEQCTLSAVTPGERHNLHNLIDFTWWSTHILTLASRSGRITMIDIVSGVKFLENEHEYSMPILERGEKFPGHIFLLESRSEESCESSDFLLLESINKEIYKRYDSAKLRWSLIAFSERSVLEMYDVLISSQKYQVALDFADRHGLDKDEVLKAQWLQSAHGMSEISTLLSSINDQAFVISECLGRVGPTENAARALLAYGLRLTNHVKFSESEDGELSQVWDFRLARVKLLHFRDRLETFLGINMGRFSLQDYNKFRNLPINEAAIALAESGKIGALNLLFKRHPYSVAPFMLEILAAIPETVPVQTYGQLLPGNSPPPISALREEDWVECKKMVDYINKLPDSRDNGIHIRTEPIVKQLLGYTWPSINELSKWYKTRAKVIDTLSGQLDNCLCLIDFACRKGINELQQYYELVSYLHQLIYTAGDDGDETNFTMTLIAWEQLSDYEKFKLMLKGFKEENVIKKLHEKAIPFMKKSFDNLVPSLNEVADNRIILDKAESSFLVKWMKEIAMDSKLDICLIIIEEGCKEFGESGFFRNDAEAIECALQCLYLCTATDKWSTMASLLSKLPHLQDSEGEVLKNRLKLADGHVEAGRLLTFYQVPKPISFFLEAHSDGKGVKQILRLIISKFIRRQPGRTDNDWANMWRDFQCLQEKAFTFVDLEYMLIEFCRGLLKAGKFSLARNYLKGSGSIVLPTDKAENLVIQAAREYFFSASSLACSEIWKAKECLNIFPSNRNIMVEADIIDALTNKLPNLGVNLLPMQFRQIKDPMEIIKLAITSQGGAYINVDELIEIAKLLGLRAQDEISNVQEAIAREAAVAGDLQLAFDLCLVLAKKGHGPVWDLCAALARGPLLENMDINSRKQLLGFALSHCDKESIGELLLAWKDLDLQGQFERLATLTRKDSPNFSRHGSLSYSYPFHSTQDIVDPRDWPGQVNGIVSDEQEVHFSSIKHTISEVANNLTAENDPDWESLLTENGKLWTFVALHLPWLIELSHEAENGKRFNSSLVSRKLYMSIRTQAVGAVLSWLARNGFSPRDCLIGSLAKSIMEPPATEEEDILGCSFLLNLIDAFHGVEIIEDQVKTREDYYEISSIMNVGMIYSLLHNSGAECKDPTQRRELLLRKFEEKHAALGSDERDKFDEAQSSFWREWKLKLEEHKRVADHARVLVQIIPGVETARFLAGDINYMESVVFSLVESVKLEKKRILKDVMKVAYDYGLNHTKVLQKFLGSILISEVWTIDEIKSEVSEFKNQILECAGETIIFIARCVYPDVDGHNKQRLAYIYELLSDCCHRLAEAKETIPIIHPDLVHVSSHGLARLYKIMGQECNKISYIEDLNFKNIAGLQGLNLDCFSIEVFAHIDEKSVEALAEMVKTLAGAVEVPVPEGLLPWQFVYRNYVVNSLTSVECNAKSEIHCQSPESLRSFIKDLEHTYYKCKKYIRAMAYPGICIMDIMKRFITIILSLNISFDSPSNDSKWMDCLIVLLTFWFKLTEDIQELISHDNPEYKFNPNCLRICLMSFLNIVEERKILPSEGWESIFAYVNCGLMGDVSIELYNFCSSMIFSGCRFEAIAYVFSSVISQFPPDLTSTNYTSVHSDNVMDLAHLYLSLFEALLKELATGSLKHQNLFRFLFSLSKMEGDLEDLREVRCAVWERMANFSDDLHIPSDARVYMLELMQCITATDKSFSMFSSELKANVLPWEGWENIASTSSNSEIANNEAASVTGTSNRVTHTLVALKSTQLVSAISPTMEITPVDLSTLGSAVSCFLKLCESAISRSHVDALLAILGEWEGLFTDVREEVSSVQPASDGGNDWGNDDWDEGWESWKEEKETPKPSNTLLVHPLHACWREIFKKLASLSRFTEVLKLIDQSVPKGCGVLLDEEDTRSLSENLDCFTALKISMLLPFQDVQLQYLGVMEGMLKEGNVSDTIIGDHEFFVLLLSSGLIYTIITEPSYGTTFSCISYMVGNYSRQSQEAQLSRIKNRATSDEKDHWFLFRRILFPSFVSELVKANQHILAGLVVTKFMHTNASLGLINVAEASLLKYLEKQIEDTQGNRDTSLQEIPFCESLVNTVTSLRSRLETLIPSTLHLLSPTDVRW